MAWPFGVWICFKYWYYWCSLQKGWLKKWGKMEVGGYLLKNRDNWMKRSGWMKGVCHFCWALGCQKDCLKKVGPKKCGFFAMLWCGFSYAKVHKIPRSMYRVFMFPEINELSRCFLGVSMTPAKFPTPTHRLSNEKKHGWLGYIGHYTPQFYRHYNTPL